MMRGSRNATFRLAPVLELRERRTDEAQQELAQRAQAALVAQDALDDVLRARDALATGGLEADAASLATLESIDSYDGRLRNEAEQRGQIVVERRADEAQALATLLARRQEQRALEKLRERQLQARRARERAAEARLFDDLTAARFERRAPGNGGEHGR